MALIFRFPRLALVTADDTVEEGDEGAKKVDGTEGEVDPGFLFGAIDKEEGPGEASISFAAAVSWLRLREIEEEVVAVILGQSGGTEAALER
jgi:hypothetical protein